MTGISAGWVLAGAAGWHRYRQTAPVPPSHVLRAGCRKHNTGHERLVDRRFVVLQIVTAAFSKPISELHFILCSKRCPYIAYMNVRVKMSPGVKN